VREGHLRTHTHAHTHTSNRAHAQSISRCPLELSDVKKLAFVFIWLGCLEILHLFLPPARSSTPPNHSRHCLPAPRPPFTTPVLLYPFVPFSFSTVLPLTIRQSVHQLLCRWSSQMPLPPQCLLWLLTRWCSQMLLLPHSLHLLLTSIVLADGAAAAVFAPAPLLLVLAD